MNGTRLEINTRLGVPEIQQVKKLGEKTGLALLCWDYDVEAQSIYF